MDEKALADYTDRRQAEEENFIRQLELEKLMERVKDHKFMPENEDAEVVTDRLMPRTPEEMAFFKVLDEVGQVFLRKHHDYGPRNIAVTGDVGVVVRMADKVMRLVNMRIDHPERTVLNESIDDAFMDLSVYGIIALLCRRGLWPGVSGTDVEEKEIEKP